MGWLEEGSVLVEDQPASDDWLNTGSVVVDVQPSIPARRTGPIELTQWPGQPLEEDYGIAANVQPSPLADPLAVQAARSVVDRYRSQKEPLAGGYSSFLAGAERVLKGHTAQSPNDEDESRAAWASAQLEEWTKPTPLPPEKLQAQRELEKSMGMAPGFLGDTVPGIPRERLARAGLQPTDFAEALMGLQTEEGAPPWLQRNAGDWLGERMPIIGGVKRASDTVGVITALTRMKAAEDASTNADPRDYWKVAQFLKTASDEEKRGFWSSVGDMASRMPAFMTEFAMTGGAFSGGKKLAEIAAARSTKGLIKGVARKVAVKTIGAAVGVAAHTVANPQLVAEGWARQMVPEMQFSTDEQGRLQQIIVGESKGFAEAFGKGFLDAYIKLGSERTGGFLGKVPWAKIPVANKIAGLKGAVVARLIRKGKTISQIEGALKAGGWSNLGGEWMEERVEDVARGVTGVSEDFGATGGALAGDPKAWKQLATEAVAFSLIPVGQSALATSFAGVEAGRRGLDAKDLARVDAIPGKFKNGEDISRKDAGALKRVFGWDLPSNQASRTAVARAKFAKRAELKQEAKDAGTIPSTQEKVREGEGRAPVRGDGQEQAPAEPASEGTETPEVQVEEPAPEAPASPEDFRQAIEKAQRSGITTFEKWIRGTPEGRIARKRYAEPELRELWGRLLPKKPTEPQPTGPQPTAPAATTEAQQPKKAPEPVPGAKAAPEDAGEPEAASETTLRTFRNSKGEARTGQVRETEKMWFLQGEDGKERRMLKSLWTEEAAPKAQPDSVTEETGAVQTIAGKMNLDEFDDHGYTVEQVTREDWVNLQRANRRKLGQPEESGPPVAPYSDYENYHEQAVREAVAKGEEVDPEVLKDYPDLVSEAPEAAKPAKKAYGESNTIVTKSAYEKARENIRRVGRGEKPLSGLDPSLLPDAVKIGLYHFEAGSRKFGDWAAKMAEDFGRDVQEHLPDLWQRIKGRPDSPLTEEEVQKIARELGEVQPLPETAPPTETTGTKNVKTEELRAAAGLGERVQPTIETQKELDAEAARIIKADPLFAPRLAAEVLGDPRAKASPIREHVLGRYIQDLENRRQAGDDVRDELRVAVEASERLGTEEGRTFRARQEVREADFSLPGIVRQHIDALGKQPSDEQMAKYEELADRITVLEGELSESQQKLAQAEVNKRIAEAKASSKRPPGRKGHPGEKTPGSAKKGTKKERLQRQASDAVASFKDAWKEALKTAATAATKPKSLGFAPEQAVAAAKVAKAAAGVVKAYAELGVNSFLEFMARAKADIGVLTADQTEAFSKAWTDAKVEPPIAPNAEPSGIGALARKLTTWAVESGVEGREEVIGAVHEELAAMGLDLTRSQVMQAMSGYGEFRELSKDEVSVTVRGIKGEIQQLLKLEDMQAGQAPKKTGVERREPTDEERRLLKRVNEAKKRGGHVVTDPARQLKSALATAKTTMRNRIADLEQEIAAKEKVVKDRTPLKPDAELLALREKRDALLEEHKRIFPPKKTGISDARRLEMAEASIDRQIKAMEADAAAGKLGPKEKRAPLTSDALEQKKQRRAELYEARDIAREASPAYQAQETARQNVRYEKSLQRQLAFWETRLAEAKQGKLPRKRIKKTPAEQAILAKQADIAEVRKEATREIARLKREQRPQIQKVAEIVPETLNALRAIKTSFDLSAVLRQGGVLAAAHPMISKDAFVPMLKAFASERGQTEATEAIKGLPSADLAQQAGLEITTDEQSLSAMEEAYMSRLTEHISGVSHSARAYMTFLNVQRAMVFDSLVAELGRTGKVTLDEAKIIANWVNVASGRGNMGRAQGAATALATAFFAPRNVLSRFQLLLGQPLWTGLLKGQGGARARLLVAKEYGRVGSALGLFYGTFALMASLFWDPDDEDKPTVSFDTRSPDFGKLKFGETRIDPLSGLAQVTTLLGRLWHGETVNARGEVRPLVAEKGEYVSRDLVRIGADFVRSKLSPALGTAIDIRIGENVVGEETTLATELVSFRDPARPLGAATPLIWEDVYEAMQAQGATKGTALGILAILGASSQTYGDRFKYETGNAEERRDQFEKDLGNMQWDTPRLGYSDLLSPEQRKQAEDKRAKKKRAVVFAALHEPDRKTHISDETFATSIATRDKALESFREMGLSYEEAGELLIQHAWKPTVTQPMGTELKGNVLKKAYFERGKILTKLYGKPEKDFMVWYKDWMKTDRQAKLDKLGLQNNQQ